MLAFVLRIVRRLLRGRRKPKQGCPTKPDGPPPAANPSRPDGWGLQLLFPSVGKLQLLLIPPAGKSWRRQCVELTSHRWLGCHTEWPAEADWMVN